MCGSHLKNVEGKEFMALVVNDSLGTSVWVLTPSSMYLLYHVTYIYNSSDMVWYFVSSNSTYLHF